MKKILALLSFVSLLTIFVLFRGGAFDKYLRQGTYPLQRSPNGGPVSSNDPMRRDTTLPLSDSLKKIMNQRKDSLAERNRADSLLRNQIMWSGSKSGRAISVYDLELLKNVLIKDTLRPTTDTAQKAKVEEPKRMLGSSKSAAVFKPADFSQNNELIRIFKIYAGDSAGLRRALERYFRPRQ